MGSSKGLWDAVIRIVSMVACIVIEEVVSREAKKPVDKKK